jgi:hypothetical protein
LKVRGLEKPSLTSMDKPLSSLGGNGLSIANNRGAGRLSDMSRRRTID